MTRPMLLAVGSGITIFVVAMIWAGIAFWSADKKNPLLLYFFAMGAPVFIFYFLYTFRARVQPNWIAPSVVPLFALMAVYFDQRWRGRGVMKICGARK